MLLKKAMLKKTTKLFPNSKTRPILIWFQAILTYIHLYILGDVDNIKLVSGKSKDSGSKNPVRAAKPAQSKNNINKPVAAAPVKRSPTPPRAKKPSGGSGYRKVVIICAAVLALIFAGFCGIGVYANGLETVFPNVSMEGVSLAGKTVAEAADTLIAYNIGTDTDKELTVNLPADCSVTISAKDAGCYLSAPDAAVYAYDACHGGSYISNALSYIKCALSGMELKAADAEKLDEEYLNSKISEGVKAANLALMQTSVDIGDDRITVIKGASSVKINSDDLYDTIEAALTSGNYTTIEYEAEATANSNADELNLQNLYDTIFEEPINAEYDPGTKQATAHTVGRSFDLDNAKKLWKDAKNGDMVVIPLIITEPEITTEKLNSMLFSDLLAQKTTSLAGSSSARINNVTKAATSINGVILNPDEEFSYNNTLGQRTTAAGYQAAGAYSGGQVVQEVGGGICQVSSTLYYCALISNLEIVDRTCHYFGVSYLPAGLDATVSWPTPDFKFKNDTDYPIKITASVDKAQNTLTVQINGSNPDGIKVELSTQTWQLADGYGAQSYRSVYDKDGNLISKTDEAKSRYYYHVSPSPSPSESEEPSASPSPSQSVTPSPTQPVSPSPSQPVSPTPSGAVNPVSETDVE